jgi:hypothetical protein
VWLQPSTEYRGSEDDPELWVSRAHIIRFRVEEARTSEAAELGRDPQALLAMERCIVGTDHDIRSFRRRRKLELLYEAAFQFPEDPSIPCRRAIQSGGLQGSGSQWEDRDARESCYVKFRAFPLSFDHDLEAWDLLFRAASRTPTTIRSVHAVRLAE